VLHTISGVNGKRQRYKEQMTKREVKKLCILEKDLISTYKMQVLEKPSSMKQIEVILKKNAFIS